MRSRKFSELPPRGRAWALLTLAASLVLVVAAERDIQHRSSAEVRGSKLMWRMACLNALGALTYFALGRRRESR